MFMCHSLLIFWLLFNYSFSICSFSSQRLRHTFQEFNRSSSSSTLSKDNLKAGASSLAVELTDAQVDALFRKFDTDADGQISYSEFVRMLAIQ